jgi:hypothetical protein
LARVDAAASGSDLTRRQPDPDPGRRHSAGASVIPAHEAGASAFVTGAETVETVVAALLDRRA